MSLTMYQACVPVFNGMLNNLSHVIATGKENADARKIDEQVFLNSRLAPDMLPLSRQVQIATDHAKGAASRLAGKDNPSYPDDEKDFAALKGRIEKTRNYLDGFTPEDMEGSADREIILKIAGNDIRFTGVAYLQGFAIPNYYFHMTTAYNILRHNGVPLGKFHFFGRS